MPDNGTSRAFAEIGGYYVGALPALIPVFWVLADGGFKGYQPLYIGIPSVVAASFTGALGAWGFGRLLGGDGGYGWTWLGGILAVPATLGFVPGAGAALAFELSSSRACRESERPRRAALSPWFLAPTVDPTGPSTRYGLALTLVL